MFIMADGIDGSGKSTVIETWKESLTAAGKAIFDLKAYWLKTGRYPELSELKSYDFIFTAEPTFVGIGQVIRAELIKNGTSYPPSAIAQAYALDRLILYKKIIIPLLAENKGVIQDRGVSTSLCYQALAGDLTLFELLALPGNALALTHRPDHLILLTLDANQALKRLTERVGKRDNVIFEQRNFQRQAARRFMAPEFQKIFTDHGSAIHQLPANTEIGIMKKQAISLLSRVAGIPLLA